MGAELGSGECVGDELCWQKFEDKYYNESRVQP